MAKKTPVEPAQPEPEKTMTQTEHNKIILFDRFLTASAQARNRAIEARDPPTLIDALDYGRSLAISQHNYELKKIKEKDEDPDSTKDQDNPDQS